MHATKKVSNNTKHVFTLSLSFTLSLFLSTSYDLVLSLIMTKETHFVCLKEKVGLMDFEITRIAKNMKMRFI